MQAYRFTDNTKLNTVVDKFGGEYNWKFLWKTYE